MPAKALVKLAGTLIILIAVGYLGFQVQPQARPPLESAGEVEVIELPTGLPATVHDYYEAVMGNSFPKPKTAVAWGRGRLLVTNLPVIGELWMPVTWTAYLVPGEEFTWEANVKWFGITVLHRGEKYAGGRGRITEDNVTESEYTDRGEYTALWLYTVLFCPSALLHNDRVDWEGVNESTARLHFPYRGERWELTLHLDPVSYRVKRIDTVRTDDKTGEKRPYQVTVEDYREFEGTLLPSHMGAAWGNSSYVFYNVDGIKYNVNVSGKLPAASSDIKIP